MGKRVLFLAVGAVSLAFPGFAATFGVAECVPGIDSYAMAVDREGDRLYVGEGDRLTVLDISDPLKPRALGSVAGMDRPRQVAVRDGIAYLVSRETGLRIVDCTDPKAPRIRARFDSVEFATGVDVAGKVAFLSERINGVEFVDVSDPDRPAHIAIRKTGESQSSRYRDGYLYSGEWGGGHVTVFDAHDMRNIREICQLDLHGFGDGLEIAGDYLYCSTGHDAKLRPEWKGEESVGRGRGMDIFSLADPARPKHVGRVDFPRFKPRNEDFWTVRYANGVAYCADSHNGLFAVDVSDPAHPKVLDRFCVPQKDKPDWPSAAISSLTVGEGCLYVTASPGGLYVIPVKGMRSEKRRLGTLPLHPEFREPYPTDEREFFVYRPSVPGQARSAVVRGAFIYAAFGDAGLHVLKAGPDGFEKVGELPGGRRVLDCCFVGDKFVTAEGLDGFAVYALEGPSTFREEQRRARISPKESVAFWCWAPDDRTVVLTSRTGARHFYSISDICGKSSLAISGTCQWDRYLADRALDGVLPELVPYRGMQWVSLSEGVARRLGALDLSFPAGQTCGVCAFDDRTFLATFSSHHAVAKDGKPIPKGSFFAFADKDERKMEFVPIPADRTIGGGFSGTPRACGNLVALNNRSGHKAALFDLTDRKAPKLLKAWALAGNPDLCAFVRGKVLIPAGHQGLLLAK